MKLVFISTSCCETINLLHIWVSIPYQGGFGMDDTILEFISITVASTSALVGIVGGFLVSRALMMAGEREAALQKGQEARDQYDLEAPRFQRILAKLRDPENENSPDHFKLTLESYRKEQKINDLIRIMKESAVRVRASHPAVVWGGLILLALCAFVGILLPLVSLTWDKQDFPVWLQNMLCFYQGSDLKKWLFWDMVSIILSVFFYFGIAMYQVFISPKFGRVRDKIDRDMKNGPSLREAYERLMDEQDK